MIYLDGRFVAQTKKQLDKLTPGRVRGRGVFETMRAQGQRILFIKEHLVRLHKGLGLLRIPSPYRAKDYEGIVHACLARAGFRCSRVRLMVWRPSSKIHVAVVVTPYRPLSLLRYKKGYQVGISRRSLDPRDLLFAIKSIHYKKFYMAYQSAVRSGLDDVILLDRQGHVIETSRANIFLITQGKILTPHLRYGCLDGITRRKVVRMARGQGIPCRETKITARDLVDADEVFCTNSLIGIMPLARIDQVTVGSGVMGPMTKKLWQKYQRYID